MNLFLRIVLIDFGFHMRNFLYFEMHGKDPSAHDSQVKTFVCTMPLSVHSEMHSTGKFCTMCEKLRQM